MHVAALRVAERSEDNDEYTNTNISTHFPKKVGQARYMMKHSLCDLKYWSTQNNMQNNQKTKFI